MDFFSSFFKVSLFYHLLFKEDVFNNSFWKICIKITNHVEPGLNLLECHVLRNNDLNSIKEKQLEMADPMSYADQQDDDYVVGTFGSDSE